MSVLTNQKEGWNLKGIAEGSYLQLSRKGYLTFYHPRLGYQGQAGNVQASETVILEIRKTLQKYQEAKCELNRLKNQDCVGKNDKS